MDTPDTIPGPMDHKRYKEPIRRPAPRVKRHPVRPEGLGFHMPRSRTGQPAWFTHMQAYAKKWRKRADR